MKNLKNIIIVSVMASMIFVTTYFFKIEIPTPVGPTMLKLGNALCLAAGLLFGGVMGGLASGIGSVMYDIMNPLYISSAPFTLVFFYLMGYVTGKISHSGGRGGNNTKFNILGASLGAITYLILSTAKNIIFLILNGSSFLTSVASNSIKFATSATNAVIAVTLSVILVGLIKRHMKKLP